MRREDVRLKLYRGQWSAVWTDSGKTRRASLHSPDRAVADRNFETWIAAQNGPRETVGEIVDAYLADRQGKPSHQRSEDAWKRLRPTFGNLLPAGVTRLKCREYSAMRGRLAKPGTIIKELSVLRAALNWHDKRSPAVFEMPQQPPPLERYLTREEYRSLRDAADQPHARLFIILAYSTAARSSAALELTWDRVDFDRGIVRLATQDEHGNKGRATVPMTNSLRAALEDAQRAAQSEFVIEYGGKRVLKIRRAFGTACTKAKLAGVTPHVLRHTAAVHMAEAGRSMSEIAQYLGHRDSRITERVYARYSPDYLRHAAAALE